MISYCTNVHPAASWDETKSALMQHIPLIREELHALDPSRHQEDLGVGLWLSARASKEVLNNPQALDFLKHWIPDQQARIETMNGFPFGIFHGARVKEQVFLPDWTTSERLDYTKDLFTILSGIGSDKSDMLSVSTVPASHSLFHANEKEIYSRIADIAQFLDRLSQQTGKLMQLGLEPEPCGHFYDTDGTIRFFNRLREAVPNPDQIERHIGLTYDTCHFAILWESPEQTLRALEQNRISLTKVQFSNAPEIRISHEEDLVHLHSFDDGVYFHQTGIQTKTGYRLFPDLSPALERACSAPDEVIPSTWRLHYHIPLYSSPQPPFVIAGEGVAETMRYLKKHPELRPHWETETYTWSVLPPQLKSPLYQQIAKELHYLHSLKSK